MVGGKLSFDNEGHVALVTLVYPLAVLSNKQSRSVFTAHLAGMNTDHVTEHRWCYPRSL